MKRLIAIGLSLFLTDPAWASLIAHANCGGNTLIQCTTGAVDTTGATLFVAVVSGVYGGAVSDSQSNGWTQAESFIGNNNRYLSIFYVISPTTSASQTFSSAGGYFPGISVTVYNDAGITFDNDAADNGNDSTGLTVQSGTIFPSFSHNLIVSGMGGDNYGPYSVDTGFTIGDSLDKIPNTYEGAATAYLYQAGTASPNPTWTVTTNDGDIISYSATFGYTPSGGVVVGGSKRKKLMKMDQF